MKLCPYRLQDAIWRVRLKAKPELRFSLCFECDSVWLLDQPISDQVGTTFDKYMHALGRAADWKGIEKLEVMA